LFHHEYLRHLKAAWNSFAFAEQALASHFLEIFPGRFASDALMVPGLEFRLAVNVSLVQRLGCLNSCSWSSSFYLSVTKHAVENSMMAAVVRNWHALIFCDGVAGFHSEIVSNLIFRAFPGMYEWHQG
jgi:hypothetical protein